MLVELIDMLIRIGTIIVQHYYVVALLMLVHLVVVLLLVHSRKEKEPWPCALKLWKEARREWKRARVSLRRANRELKTAAENGEKQERTAREKEESAYMRFHKAREQLNEAGRGVHKEASIKVKCELKYFYSAAKRLRKIIRELSGSTCCSFKSVISWILKHQPLLAGIVLALVAFANDYIYYSIFNFNILPYHSDPAGGALIMVVSVMLAITVVLLVIISMVIFTVIVIIPSTVLLSIILLVWVVVFVLGQSSVWALGFYRRSVRLSQFILLLASAAAGFLEVLQNRLNDTIEMVTCRSINSIGKTNVPKVVWSFSSPLIILVLVCVAFIEPQYRAHEAYYGGDRVMVVVNQPPEGFSNPMIKIGSNRSYLFAVPDESRSTGDGCASAGSAGLEQSGDGNGEWQNVGIVVAVEQWLLDPIQSLWSKLRLSAQDRWDFIFNCRPLGFKGAVVALPAPRVHCVYEEEGSGQESKLCVPTEDQPPLSNQDGDELFLREQIADEIGCCKHLIVSKPFVFMPGEWKKPIDQKKAEKQVCEFKRKYWSLLQSATKRTLYVFGFASADGTADHNKQLARHRAKKIRDLVELSFPGWRIVPRSLGEDHLTNGVANSRSARLAFCAQSAPEAPS